MVRLTYSVAAVSHKLVRVVLCAFSCRCEDLNVSTSCMKDFKKTRHSRQRSEPPSSPSRSEGGPRKRLEGKGGTSTTANFRSNSVPLVN